MKIVHSVIIVMSVNDYSFGEGFLYIQIDNDGSFSSNKDLIYKTSHKIQAPYFIYCKQSS